MAHLLFDVNGQKILRKDTFFAVAKSVGYLTAKFNFLSEEWEGKSVTAIFTREDDSSIVKYAILDDNDECFVPNEVLQKAGNVNVSVFSGSSEIVTTNYATVFLNPSGFAVGDESLDPPSPDAYEQMTEYFNVSRQEVAANKEFVEEAVEKFKHIDGGLFTSDDWTGEETEDDPQNSTIQIRGGDDTDFDGEKLRNREMSITNDGKFRIKTNTGDIVELAKKTELDSLGTSLSDLDGAYTLTAAELNDLVGNVNILRQLTDGSVSNGYVGDDGCLYLTNAAGAVVVGPLGPFAGGGGEGGGGGGGQAYSRITLENAIPGGERSFTITEDDPAIIKIRWASTDVDSGEDTGSGTLKVYRTGALLYSKTVAQGDVEIDVTEYIKSGDNDFRVSIVDINNQTRSLVFNFTQVALSIRSDFDSTRTFIGDIDYSCVPYGGFPKRVIYELDGDIIYTSGIINSSGVRASHSIPAQSHGYHKLKVWVEATVNNGSTVKSDVLYYELLCAETNNANTVIASNFQVEEAVQYTPLPIEFRVYSSRSTSVDATITIKTTDENGVVNTTESQLTVGRGSNTFNYRPDVVGDAEITIRANEASRTFNITVTESDIKAKPTTDSMVLYLSSAGRSNSERNPATWTYNGVTTSFSNFNWVSSGWNADEDGEIGLQLINDARAVVGYKPHEVDWKNSGKTIEIEFRSHTVRDYDAKIIQCYVDGRGFYITPTKFVLQYVGGSIEAPFKENEHITIAVTVEKYTTSFHCYRLVRLYINGICSAVVQYPTSAIFNQTTPAMISIGSNDAGVTVYKFRIYNSELTRRQVVDNWIADTKSIEKMLVRYTRNNIYDDNGNIVLSKLPVETPYLIISTSQTLPTKKKDPAILVSGYFIWPEHPEKSFSFYDGQLTVQGTSSEGYDIKNWKLKFANGFYLLASGETISKFKMAENSVGINKPCLKADYASSESANNVVLVQLYNDISVYRTPHQQVEDYKADHEAGYEPLDIRQGVDGFGMMMFQATDNDLRSKVRANSLDLTGIADLDVTFMGKYNFNNDKGNEDVFGFTEGDESWEWKVNSGGIVNMLDGVMDDWEAETVDEGGNVTKVWKTQIEARYPEDNEDYSNVKAFIDFVKSTDVVTPLKSDAYLTAAQKAAINAESDTSAKEALENQYKEEFKMVRLQKFHQQIGNWIELRAFAFNFIFKEFFLMIDNWVKNAFWTIMKDTVNGTEVQSKWFDLPYDMDTAIGTDNNGNLVFSPFLEGTDHYATVPKSALDPNKSYDIINEANVDGVPMVTIVEWSSEPIDGVTSRTNIYNGQECTLYVNWQNPNSNYGYMDLSREVYRGLRSSGALTFEKVRTMFKDHQDAWSEAMFNEDGEVKYLSVLYKNGSGAHLPKLLGSKASQRDYWLYYRFMYEDSKYVAGDGADYIETRTYAPNEGVTITPYVTSYVTAEWGNNGVYVQKRVHAGESAELPSTMADASGDNDNVLYIYCAAMVQDLGDLSKNQLGYIELKNAYNITRVKVGDSNPNYVNSQMQRLIFRTLESGAEYPMCKIVDARNCINLGSGINNTPKVIYLKSCTNLEEAYFDGTSIEGLELPTTGTLRVVHYSSSAKSVIIKDQPNITDLVVPAWDQCDTVVLENVGEAVDVKNLYTHLKNHASVRLSGFEWTASSVAEINSWLDAIDAKQFDWLDENGLSTRIAGQDYADQEKTLSCTIHIDDITGAEVAAIREKWIGIKIIASSLTAVCTFMNGSAQLGTSEVLNGGDAVYTGATPTKASDNEFNYTFAGWALTADATVPFDGALTGVTEDRTVYAVFTATHKRFTLRFYNGAVLLEEDLNVEYGTHPSYDSDIPISPNGRPFTGWTYNETSFVDDPSTLTVTGDMDFYATFLSSHTVTFYNGSRKLQEVTVDHGSTANYGGTNPKSSTGAPFIGWSSDGGRTVVTNLNQVPIYTDTDFYAQFTPVYTVRFFRYAGDAQPVLTVENVIQGENANYTGEVITGDHGEALLNWNPSNINVTEDRDCIAVFETLYKVEYYVGNELYYTDNYLHYGDNSTCPTTPTMSGSKFAGWVPAPNNITRDTKVYATFSDTFFVKYFANEDDENPIYTDEGLDPGDDSTFEGTLPVGPYGAPFVRWDPEPVNVQANMYTYAVYETRYTVRFFSENGAVTYHTVNGVAANATVAYPSTAPVPEKNGYEFIGWSSDGGTTVVADTSTVPVTGNTDWYAQFRKLHTVRFYVNGNLDATVSSVSNGSTVTYPNSTPVDDVSGGPFLGWAIDNAGAVYNDLTQVPITADTDFYAKFGTAYVVSFYANDGDVTPYEVVKGVAPGGTATPTKGDPTKSGYIFTGWDPQPTNIQGNINVYAEWERVYTVRYMVDGTAVQSSTTVRAGETYTYTGTTPTKSGYEFTGWSPTPGVVNADVDYVAQWIQLHTVRFMDGATVLQTVNNVRHGEYASYTNAAPTKSGYRFTGWNNDPATTAINADTDFTAQWIQTHTVRFMADGVAVQTINNVDHGSKATFTGTEPTKSGYRFNGWDKDPANTVINADTDFVAQWEEDGLDALCVAIDDGTYATKYSVGNKITIPIDGVDYETVIMGIDTDVDANNNTIPITLGTVNLVGSMRMNTTNTNNGGWEASVGRTTVAGYESKLPESIQIRLIAAKKYSYNKTTGADQITYDKLWIPSCKELGLGNDAGGPVYSSVYTGNNARIKKLNGEAKAYWTRTAVSSSSSGFRSVKSSGEANFYNSGSTIEVALCFCLGKDPEIAAWDNLKSSVQNNTYSTNYHVGDELPYTTTDGDTYHAVIAGIDADVDANGNTIPITFVTKELYKTTYPMNTTATNAGGWNASLMRTSTMPALKAKLPKYVTRRIVAAKKYSYDKDTRAEQTTIDEVWIPNYKEVDLTSPDVQESGGATYSSVFSNQASRVKKLNGTATNYWTRSSVSSNNNKFLTVYSNGAANNNNASDSYGVALGFCIG